MAVMAAFRVVLFGGTVVLIKVVLVSPEASWFESWSVQLAATAATVATVSSLAQLVWTRWGSRLDVFAMPQLLLDQILITVIVYLSGGVSSGATSLYGVTCLAGSWLLGVPGAVATALSAGVSFSLMVLLQQVGALPVPRDQSAAAYAATADQTTYYVIVNLLVLSMVALLASYLAERLEKAGGELLEARRRADQAERMAAMGRLAAGLAHEIRNPLSSIAGAVQILRSGLEHAEDRELCEIVLRESGRLEELVSDMVDLAKPRRPHIQVIDVGAIVQDVVELGSKSGRALGDVTIRRHGLDDAWIRGDSSQLRQLVWNLVRNAVQASASGGEVRVSLVGEADEVVLIVEDDGAGIDSEARAQLFDAFFTTRSHGTGIGLAVVKRIADEHGFRLAVQSDEGEGARFSLYLGAALPAPSTR